MDTAKSKENVTQDRPRDSLRKNLYLLEMNYQENQFPMFLSVIVILFSKEKTTLVNETGNRFSFLLVDVNPDSIQH